MDPPPQMNKNPNNEQNSLFCRQTIKEILRQWTIYFIYLTVYITIYHTKQSHLLDLGIQTNVEPCTKKLLLNKQASLQLHRLQLTNNDLTYSKMLLIV